MLRYDWGVVDVWPIEAVISASTIRWKRYSLLERVVNEGGMFHWLLGWEGVEKFLRDIFIFKDFFRKEREYFFMWEKEIGPPFIFIFYLNFRTKLEFQSLEIYYF